MERITHNIKHKTSKLFIVIGFFLFLVSCFMFHVSWTLAQVKLEVGLPNLPGGQIPAGSEFPDYIKYLFLFGLGLITIIALAQMMIGGLKYILAAGNVSTTEDAKKQIQQALIGMAVLLLSYLLLNIINPDLVSLRNPGLVPLDLKIEGQLIPGGAPGTNLVKCGTTNCVSTEMCINGACVSAAPPIAP